MNAEILIKRTKLFAHRCVKLAVSLPNSQLGSHIRGQLIRSGTSVAANYRAACKAQSKASFVAKISIVIEEADESLFWLEFVGDEKIVKMELITDLMREANELLAITVSSINTARKSGGRQ